MGNRQKLLKKANNSPSNLRFSEICKLAEDYGWEFKRQKGSHCQFSNPTIKGETGSYMNFQEGKGGVAKESQVKQLLDAIVLHNLDKEDE
ncbi:MAG: type II toxin-antitoxin system HicA family toxin [Aridibacter sp.]|jgi:hypothetical protein